MWVRLNEVHYPSRRVPTKGVVENASPHIHPFQGVQMVAGKWGLWIAEHNIFPRVMDAEEHGCPVSRQRGRGRTVRHSCQREKACVNWLLVREGGFCQFPEMGCTGVPECRASGSGESSLDSANAVGDDDWIPA